VSIIDFVEGTGKKDWGYSFRTPLKNWMDGKGEAMNRISGMIKEARLV
jgi:hypothetical protein